MSRHIEFFETFKDAARYASERAADNAVCVRLVRAGTAWQVIFPPGCTPPPVDEPDYSFEDPLIEALDEAWQTERDVLLRDMADDAADYARSESDGWYYGDEAPIPRDSGHPGDDWYFDRGFGGWFHYDWHSHD